MTNNRSMFSQDLFDDYYMEKPQWDRLTLGSTFNYQSQNYFGEGYTQQKVVNLFEYLIFMNFKGFSSFEKYRDQNQRTQLFNQEDSNFNNNFLIYLKYFFYTIPNPFVARQAGWGGGGQLLAAINFMVQVIPALAETVLYIIGTVVSMLYRNSREMMLNPENSFGERLVGLIGFGIFGLLNIGMLGVFCVANSINYTRKLFDATLNLFLNFQNVSWKTSLAEVGKNIVRLLPVALAIVFAFVAPPVGLYIMAKAPAISSAFSSVFSWIGTHIFHQTAAVASVHAQAAAAPVLAEVGASSWQMIRNFGNKLLIRTFCNKSARSFNVGLSRSEISETVTVSRKMGEGVRRNERSLSENSKSVIDEDEHPGRAYRYLGR